MANEKFKVQVAAKLSDDHNHYRRAGLVLSGEQREHTIDAVQLRILRADKRVVVVGGPELPKLETAEKPADPKEARLQQMGLAHDQAQQRAAAAEAENAQLKAELGALKARAESKKKKE